MKVVLIDYTSHPVELAAIAANTCYSGDEVDEILDKYYRKGGKDAASKLLANVIKSGHTAVLEHVKFTFMIDGISRACSHQLVRHRIASFAQQSQRYVKGDKSSFIVPESIEVNKEASEIFDSAMNTLQEYYNRLVELGISKEDARFVLPNATATRIVATFNAREMIHLFGLRTCMRAQWEIREMATLMLIACRNVMPDVFNTIGPNCYTSGKCPEGDRCCGKTSYVQWFFKPENLNPPPPEDPDIQKKLEAHAACDPIENGGENLLEAIERAKKEVDDQVSKS